MSKHFERAMEEMKVEAMKKGVYVAD